MEDGSAHPIVKAIAGYARAELAALPTVDKFVNVPGRGAAGQLDGQAVTVGSQRLFAERHLPVPAAMADTCRRWSERGCTCVLVALADRVIGMIAHRQRETLSAGCRHSAAPTRSARRRAQR